jgi:hypothetical protein
LVQISKEQAEYLIKNGFVKCENGRFPDITVTNRQSSKKKNRYVNEHIYNKYLKVEIKPNK